MLIDLPGAVGREAVCDSMGVGRRFGVDDVALAQLLRWFTRDAWVRLPIGPLVTAASGISTADGLALGAGCDVIEGPVVPIMDSTGGPKGIDAKADKRWAVRDSSRACLVDDRTLAWSCWSRGR